MQPEQPLDWPGETSKVIRPGAGVSGGVFIFSDADDRQVVIKPVLEGSGTVAQTQFGDAFLNAFMGDVPVTPHSRIVEGGTSEARQIANTAATNVKAPADPDKLADAVKGLANAVDGQPNYQGKVSSKVYLSFVAQLMEKTSFYKLMTKARGESLDDLMRGGAAGAAGIDTLVARLSTANLRKLGELIVADAAIGNTDRISASVVNLGNIIIDQDVGVSAIDTDADLREVADELMVTKIAKVGGLGVWYGLEDSLDDDKMTALAKEFFLTLEHHMNQRAAGGFDPVADFKAKLNTANGVTDMMAGVRNGRQRLLELMYDKAQQNKDLRQRLKAELGDGVSWETLKIHTKQAQLRSEGVAEPVEGTLRYARLKHKKMFQARHLALMDSLEAGDPAYAGFTDRPGRPADLAATEKVKRVGHSKSAEVKELKKATRGNRLSSDLLAGVEGGGGSHEEGKALFEAKMLRLRASMQTSVSRLHNYESMIKRLGRDFTKDLAVDKEDLLKDVVLGNIDAINDNGATRWLANAPPFSDVVDHYTAELALKPIEERFHPLKKRALSKRLQALQQSIAADLTSYDKATADAVAQVRQWVHV